MMKKMIACLLTFALAFSIVRVPAAQDGFAWLHDLHDAAQARIDQRFGAHIAGVAKRFGLKPVLPAEQIAQALLLLWRALALQPAGEGLRKGPREVAFDTCLRALLGVSP